MANDSNTGNNVPHFALGGSTDKEFPFSLFEPFGCKILLSLAMADSTNQVLMPFMSKYFDTICQFQFYTQSVLILFDMSQPKLSGAGP